MLPRSRHSRTALLCVTWWSHGCAVLPCGLRRSGKADQACEERNMMSGNARIISKTGIYHIMLRGNNKHTIFFDEEDYGKFFMLLNEKIKQNIVGPAMCLRIVSDLNRLRTKSTFCGCFVISIGTRWKGTSVTKWRITAGAVSRIISVPGGISREISFGT